MGINVRALVRGAGAVTILLVTTAQADDTDDVRRAVMGHEAFIQRCMQDTVDALARGRSINPATMPKNVRKQMLEGTRTVCESFYQQVNVCMPGGVVDGIVRVETVMVELDKVLTDPLTRAQTYDKFHLLKKAGERELVALHDMKEGRTDYCDMESNES